MNFLDDLGSDDLNKVRRAIYILSGFLIFFSNATMKGDEIVFFGLSFLVDQAQLKAAFKLFLCIAVVLYLLRISESVPPILARIFKLFDDAWWAPKQQAIDEYHDMQERNHFQNEYDFDEPDWDDEARAEKKRRDERREEIALAGETVSAINKFLVRVVAPIFVALIALFVPEAVLVLSSV